MLNLLTYSLSCVVVVGVRPPRRKGADLRCSGLAIVCLFVYYCTIVVFMCIKEIGEKKKRKKNNILGNGKKFVAVVSVVSVARFVV